MENRKAFALLSNSAAGKKVFLSFSFASTLFFSKQREREERLVTGTSTLLLNALLISFQIIFVSPLIRTSENVFSTRLYSSLFSALDFAADKKCNADWRLSWESFLSVDGRLNFQANVINFSFTCQIECARHKKRKGDEWERSVAQTGQKKWKEENERVGGPFRAEAKTLLVGNNDGETMILER